MTDVVIPALAVLCQNRLKNFCTPRFLQETECSICLDSTVFESTIFSFPECRHKFHKTCILAYFLHKVCEQPMNRLFICPYCKTGLTSYRNVLKLLQEIRERASEEMIMLWEMNHKVTGADENVFDILTHSPRDAKAIKDWTLEKELEFIKLLQIGGVRDRWFVPFIEPSQTNTSAQFYWPAVAMRMMSETVEQSFGGVVEHGVFSAPRSSQMPEVPGGVDEVDTNPLAATRFWT